MRKIWLSALVVLAMLTSLVQVSGETISDGHTWGLEDSDSALAVDIDAQGNVYLLGMTWGSSAGTTFLAKFDGSGALVWDRILATNSMVGVGDLAVDELGNAYVCGHLYNNSMQIEVGFLCKFSSDGALVFDRLMEEFMYPRELELDSQGVVVAGDWYWSYGAAVAAFTSSGSLRWCTYGETEFGYSSPWGLAVDSSDNIIITMDRLEQQSDVGFAMLDSGGNLIRQVIYNSSSPEEYSWDVIVGPDGYIYGLGYSMSEELLFLVKLTPSLEWVWGQKIGDPLSSQECWKLVGQSDGTLYAIGRAQNYSSGAMGPALYHFTDSGLLLEASCYSLRSFTDAVALPFGGFVLAGSSDGPVDLTPVPLQGITIAPVPDMMETDIMPYQSVALVVWEDYFTTADPVAFVDSYDTALSAQAWFGYVNAATSQLQVDITVRHSNSNPSSFTFRGTASGGDRPYTYTWQFGDGTSSVGQRATHAYASAGLYHVTLAVVDSVGSRGYAAVDVVVPGPPVISGLMYYPMPVMVDFPTTFVVDAYDPDGGELARYDWDFGDGPMFTSYTPVAEHTYVSIGTYTLEVTVTDDEGSASSSSWTIEVTEFNDVPWVAFTMSPEYGNTSTVFTFDASGCYDAEDPVSALQVRWDWESDGYWDTNWTTDKMAYHMYASPGTYMVLLEVMDTGGMSNNTTRVISVSSGDWTTLLCETFDSWGAIDPCWTIANATYLDFENWFNIQDGMLYASNNGVLVYDHYLSYANWTRPVNYSGEFELSYRIFLPLDYDEKYGWSGQVFWVILYDTSGYMGLISRFVMDNLAGTNPNGWVNWQGETPVQICPFSAGWHEIKMTWSSCALYWTPTIDGVMQNPQMFRAPSGAFEIGKIAFINALREEVNVCAVDDVVVRASGTIVTPNLPPVASFTVSPQYASVGEPVTFDASASYDPDGYITEWGWDYGDGTEGGDVVTSHPYSAPGTYTAALTVWDDDGYASTATSSVVVFDTGDRANWTFLVYEDGDNNLEDVALIDFLEMSSVGSTDEVNIVVQLDRNPSYDFSYGDWTGTKRFYVTQGMTPTPSNAVMDLGELNMGDPAVLMDFVEWGVTAFPAEKYMLVLWDHGGGWDGAVCWDDTDYGDALTLDELQLALNASDADTGERIDAIGFDACLMGMAEVAYEIRLCTDVLVFSEETVPWDGWPYDTIMAALASDPALSPLALADLVVLRYAEYYGWNGSETMSSVDVAGLISVYPLIDAFASELISCLPAYRGEIMESVGATEVFTYSDYRDLYDFAYEVWSRVPVASAQVAAADLMNGVAGAVTMNYAGEWHPDAHGLSITLPPSLSMYFPAYEYLDMSVDLMWDDFVRQLLATAPDAYEPDDTYLDANQIVLWEPQWHSIDDLGADVDWVTFDLNETTQVRICTFGGEGMGDTVLRLFNESGVPDWPIAENDDYGDSYWSRITAWLGPGTYWVEVSSYDHEAEITSYGLVMESGPFPNEPPVAQFYCYGDFYVGGMVYFEGGISFDPDGYIVSWNWDFGDGSFTSGSWVYHSYSWPGTFLVTLTVMDDQALLGSFSGWIEIYGGNLPPVAIGVISPEEPSVGELVTFDGYWSYDPDGYITAWNWYFGDGTMSSGPVVYHAYSNTGVYYVELDVCDDDGQWSWVILNVTVQGEQTQVPPVAVIAYEPSQGVVGDPVWFTGGYSVDPDGYIVEYIWQFGDGDVAFGPMASHVYEHAGTYMVSLSVIDNSGLSDETTTTITVISIPTAAFAHSPILPLAGLPVNFFAWGSSDESGIVEYLWSFGDGTYASGWQVVHTYASPGSYTVMLVVTSGAGVQANCSEVLTVVQQQLLLVSDVPGPASPEELSGSPAVALEWLALLGAFAAGSVSLVCLRRR